MHIEPICPTEKLHAHLSRRLLTSFAFTLWFSAVGCLSPLQKHTVTLSAATAPVIEGAAIAYHTANEVHDTWLDYDAVGRFDKKPVYNPETSVQPLLSDDGIEVRLRVLAAFQTYVQSLVELTNGKESAQMHDAAASVGSKLTAVANDVAPAIQATLGIATASGASTLTTVAVTSGNTITTTSSTSTAAAPPIFSPAVSSGVATAADALGRYLVNRKVKKELPKIISDMDPNLKTLCVLLEDDLAIIKSQEKMDYENILDAQTLFVRLSPAMQPEERREQIMKIPEMVRQHRATQNQLDALHKAIANLDLAHHALAAEAQSKNPQSMKAKLGELAAAGSALGTFYSSLSSK